jgi:dephospho-CoA kinase
VVEPGQPALQEVIAAFGAEFVDPDGRLRRRKLRETIFSVPERQALLESILHPAILLETMRRVADVDAPYCIVVIPLLAESGHFDWLDRILVVDAPEERQIQRLMKRDGVDEAQAKVSLGAQAGREVRLRLADDIIDNSGDIAVLEDAVIKLHEMYSALGRGKIRGQSEGTKKGSE